MGDQNENDRNGAYSVENGNPIVATRVECVAQRREDW
jgi:hypothetical protein